MFIILLFLYDSAIALLNAGLWILAKTGNKKAIQRLEVLSSQQLPESPMDVWFHAASVGEFEQARPLMEAYKTAFSHHKIALTFFSASGYALHKNTPLADWVGFLPADTSRNAAAFVETLSPKLVVWVKYEFWYYHLHAIHQKKAKLVLLSGIFRPSQLFFKPVIGVLHKRMLGFFTQFFVQNETSARLLLGIVEKEKIQVVGDSRFDRVVAIADSPPVAFPVVEAFLQNRKCLVVGSLWPRDWQAIKPLFSALPDDLCVIIAPHEIHPEQISTWSASVPVISHRYSWGSPPPNAQLLWIDNIGLLSQLYRFANYAFIGGGFGEGLHNTLEAAVFGVPIFFGDEAYKKYQEANDLLACKAAQTVSQKDNFSLIINTLLNNHREVVRRSEAARSYVRSHAGTTQKVIHFLKTSL